MWRLLFRAPFRHSVFTPVREWFSAFAPFSPLCLHSGAPVGPQARIVVSLCLHFGRQLALSSLAPAVGPFSLFFEPSRVSEALCRRQEPREGVPKRARACERGGEARRREPRGRLTTTYRTINARLPPDCERLLIFNFFSLSHSDSFRKTALRVFLQALTGGSFSWAPFSSLCLHSGA